MKYFCSWFINFAGELGVVLTISFGKLILESRSTINWYSFWLLSNENRDESLLSCWQFFTAEIQVESDGRVVSSIAVFLSDCIWGFFDRRRMFCKRKSFSVVESGLIRSKFFLFDMK